MGKNIILGITGASGSLYASNFMRHAGDCGLGLFIVASPMGESVFEHETGMTIRHAAESLCRGSYTLYDNSDMFADIASGSCKNDGMAVLPCSMKTLSSVARGSSGSLLERAADVMLKERRPLILAVRETPLSLVHLRNMTAAAEAGAVILPAAPGFYHAPDSVERLADFITGKILDQLGIEHKLDTAWKINRFHGGENR